ncbi:MAG TPA: phosphatase PAP2 family protein [Thermoleophilia bacterium]|nr:phosphatase PAP2 family protein [Thermoleophilia bacterium]
MSGTASDPSRHLESTDTFSRGTLRAWLLPSRSMQRRLWLPVLGLLYIATVGLMGGLRGDHVLVGLLGFLDLYNEKSRLFLRLFFPFMLTGVIYDSMRYYYWQGIAGRVHVAEPYLLERAWFGVGGRTLNEVFLAHHGVVLDLACGFAYLVYVGEYLALALLLFFRGRLERAGTFARCFLLVNVMGFATYFVYPAAPPWYVTRYGLGPARTDIHPTPAAAQRFDALLGTHFFDSMYGRGVDVFGALPSLHVAYPFMAVILAFRVAELRWARVPAVLFFLLMCLSAVYLQHHYVIDVVLGIAYAVAALAAVSAWERRRPAAVG